MAIPMDAITLTVQSQDLGAKDGVGSDAA